ncbi:Hint domain-containing protein [Nioella nitratireducens]|uniref:Hint domain-containing protein n=1 Tax=Nioella nitratireducens TaxID=1287720 RepID=UPI0008FCF374|nr:Hint domain-containing protein [Nioella nitratireducens]
MPRRPAQFSFPTYPAADLTVHWGANEGDPMGGINDVVPGDSYRLRREAVTRQLSIWDGPGGTEVADGSQVGQPGDRVVLDVCHSMMAPGGTLVELLILTISGDAETTRVFLPLAPLAPRGEYEVVASETQSAPARLADIASVSFISGTRLTMANGRQCRVEELKAGDQLLTRDHGPKEIRWIGPQVQRATGALAPIRISEGTLNVANDLRLFPHHRLFIWQRRDEIGTGRSEVLVKAAHLVNGTTVQREEGGHIESYQILFDAHEIIYAEGVAVESLLVTPQTRAALPPHINVEQTDADRMLSNDLEVDRSALGDDGDPAERLTRASRGRED